MKYVLDEKGRATTVGVPEYIDENIFDGCKAEVIVLPEGVKTIGEYAFCELENLREITFRPPLPEWRSMLLRTCCTSTGYT